MMSALRRWLLAGLLVLLPLMITIWVLNWIISTLDQTLQILPAHWQPEPRFDSAWISVQTKRGIRAQISSKPCLHYHPD